MEYSENNIVIRGELTALPQYSHENHQKRFFRFELAVTRLSGAVDVLPVIADETVLDALDVFGGELLEVHGQIRSHNLRENGTRRLLIFVFATAVSAVDDAPVNDVTVQGVVCRRPTLRRTPLGREICDVMLAVPRAFRRADYIPCILWGRTAQSVATCNVGDILRICGRLQSRVYTKLTDTEAQQRTAYELSALGAEILRAEE